jgi:Protein of unknown function (DUF4019)
MGPVVGSEGKPIGWLVPFLSPSANPERIRAAAVELLEMAHADAEAVGLTAVIVSAVLSFDANTGMASNFGIVFEKTPHGWELVHPVENVPPASPDISKLLEGWGGFTRNRKREEFGAKVAAQWLRLLDVGKANEAWKQTSPLLKALVSEGKWKSAVSDWVALGQVVSRVESFRLYTGFAQNLPPATYLVVSFQTRRVNPENTRREKIELRWEDDGSWKVVGYALN